MKKFVMLPMVALIIAFALSAFNTPKSVEEEFHWFDTQGNYFGELTESQARTYCPIGERVVCLIPYEDITGSEGNEVPDGPAGEEMKKD
jgi:hypothetical protein